MCVLKTQPRLRLRGQCEGPGSIDCAAHCLEAQERFARPPCVPNPHAPQENEKNRECRNSGGYISVHARACVRDTVHQTPSGWLTLGWCPSVDGRATREYKRSVQFACADVLSSCFFFVEADGITLQYQISELVLMLVRPETKWRASVGQRLIGIVRRRKVPCPSPTLMEDDSVHTDSSYDPAHPLPPLVC